MKKVYIEYRDQRIVDEILRPQGIHSIDDFQSKHQSFVRFCAAPAQVNLIILDFSCA